MFAFLAGLLKSALVFLGLSALTRALTRSPQAQAGDVDLPRVQEGEPILAVFGTVKLAPNVVWWGDVAVQPIKGPRRVFGLAGPRDTLGHRYFVGMQGALCWGPVDALVEIVVADKYHLSSFGATTTREYNPDTGEYDETTQEVIAPPLPLASVAGGQLLTIEAANLFGGKELEGGVVGNLRFYFGSATQNANAYLETHVGTPFPAYRGLCYAVWEHTYLGTTPYLKNWAFVVRRCPTTLGALAGDVTLSRVGGDANPAEVLYELWTDRRWGLGKPASDLDVDSFLAALATLKAEGLGISGTHGGTGEADAKIREIERTVDARFGEDPLTGKMRLTLIRPDYDVAQLPVFDKSNADNLSVTRPVWGERTTQVKVNYTDAAKDFTTRTRQAHNPAVQRAQGYAVPAVVSYPLFTTPANAERAAARDCRALSSSLAAGSVVLKTRAAAALGPGDPFILHFPEDGLDMVVVRGGRFDYGSIHDEGEPIRVEVAEDVFGAAGGVLVTTPPDEWEAPPATDAGRRFDVETALTVSDTQGCLTLRITGDVSSITLVETRTQKGGQPAGDWTEQDNAAPITVCVDRDAREVGHVAYRITYTDGDSTAQTLEDEFDVPPLGADDGNAEGTPGNWPLTLRTTPPLVLVGAEVGTDTFLEPPEARADRVWVSLKKVRRLMAQGGSGKAGGAGVVGVLIYSLTGENGSFQELGPTWPLHEVRYPAAGDPAAIAAGAAAADIVCLSWGTKGGNGTTTVVEIGNIYAHAFSATTPNPAPEPPEVDVPSGGPLGNIIHDLNAFSLVGVVVDGDPFDFWPDDSVTAQDAVSGPPQASPIFRETGFSTGAPCVEFSGGNSGMVVQGQITNGSFTTYIVMEDVDTTVVGFPVAVAPIFNAGNGFPKGKGVTAVGSAIVGGSGGIGGYVNTAVSPLDTFKNVRDTWGMMDPHVYRFVFDKTLGRWWLFVDGVSVCNENDDPDTPGIPCPAQFTESSAFVMGWQSDTDGVPMRWGRELTYDKAHVGAGDTAVETALRAIWGL
jgi:hypothetical protein